MNQTLILIFAIPAVTLILIAVYQFSDEMFKKQFVLERRKQRSADDDAAHAMRRRYSDSVPPGTLRNPEATDSSASSATAEAPVPQIQQV
jgi:hypothetical protein